MSPQNRPWLTSEESDLIRDFWTRAGSIEPFPRRLESSLSMALPVALVKMPHLTLRAAENWIRARRAAFAFDCDNREVCGCMVALRGNGFIFVDGGDPEDEMRFTVAHEIGHFLADVLRPRQKVIASMGPRIREVLDGMRPPTTIERLGAAMVGLPLSMQTDILDRSGSGMEAFHTWDVESRADRIGLALLAPPEAVVAAVADAPAARRREQAIGILRGKYGLPEVPAQRYADLLLVHTGRGRSIADAWRAATT